MFVIVHLSSLSSQNKETFVSSPLSTSIPASRVAEPVASLFKTIILSSTVKVSVFNVVVVPSTVKLATVKVCVDGLYVKSFVPVPSTLKSGSEPASLTNTTG